MIALLRGDPVVSKYQDEIRQGALSAVVLGELLYGTEISRQGAANRKRLMGLVSTLPLVAVDAETAPHYARLKYRLRRDGTMIPDNDLWLAATAIQHQMVVVTQDRKHFPLVEEVTVELW